jgi:glycerol-3-phosphate dehydrogenase
MQRDLLVIGGGINGVGIAADAAGRGLSVALCEMGDLASATSSASSRLIHGGLRYLETMEFKLVRESLVERSLLLHNAPHLIHLQAFVLPHCPWLRPYWMLKLGLFMYDHLAFDSKIPGSRSLNTTEISELSLKNQYTKALRYYDCTEDDSRLVVHVALLAQQHGAEILTHTKLVRAIRQADGWVVTLSKDNKVSTHNFKAIVNAAGPWVQQVATDILNIQPQYNIKLVKGSHIIVPKLFKHKQAFILQNQDDRVVFVIPYLHDFTLIGTTDIVLDHIEHPVIASVAEIEYLCEITNQFLEHAITPQDVISSYAGIRPLHDNHKQSASKTTRDYALDLNTVNNSAPVISVYGGKITTYRHLAEEVLNKLTKYFPQCGKAWTKHAYLPGGYFLNDDVESFKRYIITVYPNLPPRVLMHYVDNYGTRAGDMLRNVHDVEDLGKHFGNLLYQREVDFLVEYEWAITAEDILWRRSKMGLWLKPEEVRALEYYLAR